MMDTWHMEDYVPKPVYRDDSQRIKESRWWADNRHATIKEPFPIVEDSFKPMTSENLKQFIQEMKPVYTESSPENDAIKYHSSTRFDRYQMEARASEYYDYKTGQAWFAYCHYSKEQNDLLTSKKNLNVLLDHIKQHGQLIRTVPTC